MTGTLTIETGVRCNNRCVLCNQWSIRSAGGLIGEPSTDEIVERLRAGRAAGYDDVAFSGGEPTVRDDLPELVGRARELGYRRVGITTNGRRLAREGVLSALVDAGMTGASVTLQGPDAGTHDVITGVDGSFRQTVRGLHKLGMLAQGSRFDLSSVTVIVPENASSLGATLELAGALGAALHIVQPFIVSRENILEAERFTMSLDALVVAIEGAAGDVARRGGRIKPYNIPPCAVAHLGDTIELQDYRISTFREFQASIHDRPGFVLDGQTWRIPQCADCPARCPGFRIEHLPETDAVKAIIEDVTGFEGKGGDRGIVLTSTDLLTPSGLDEVFGGVSGDALRPVTVTWGGYARTGFHEFLGACRRHSIEEVAMVAIAPGTRPPDGHVRLPGNIDKLVADLGRMGGDGPAPSLVLVVNMLFSKDHEFPPATADALVRALVDAGGTSLRLIACEALNDGVPPPDEEFRKRVADGLVELVAKWRRVGAAPRLLLAPVPPGQGDRPTLQDEVSGLVPTEDWGDRLLRHRFTGLGFGWLMWSNPIWLFALPPSSEAKGRIAS